MMQKLELMAEQPSGGEAQGDDGHIVMLFGAVGPVVGGFDQGVVDLLDGGLAMGEQDLVDAFFVPEFAICVLGFADTVGDANEQRTGLDGEGSFQVLAAFNDADGKVGSDRAFDFAIVGDDVGGYVAGVDVSDLGAIGADDAAK
jgi:hypothetical protein